VFRITRAAIALDRLMRGVRDPAAGAVVTFVGTTRNENVGRRVIRLEYEAFMHMAVTEMKALAARATRRWRLRRVAMVHRIGAVRIGEASVAIAVSAAHRDEAFAACHWLIDELKRRVPIWKRETYRGGAQWIGAQEGGPPAGGSPDPPAPLRGDVRGAASAPLALAPRARPSGPAGSRRPSSCSVARESGRTLTSRPARHPYSVGRWHRISV
jgi:molybdopterin synthase catalytic subunit